MSSREWTPIARVGEPKIKLNEDRPESVEVRFRTAPTFREPWDRYLQKHAKEHGLSLYYDGFGMDGNMGYFWTTDAELENSISLLDNAIDHANERYEKEDVPRIAEEEHLRAQQAADVRRRQEDLNERAAKLAKPDPNARDLQRYRDL